MLNKLPS